MSPTWTQRSHALLSQAFPMITEGLLCVIVQEAALLGNSLRGTDEGLAIATQLFSLTRKIGSRITVDVVEAR